MKGGGTLIVLGIDPGLATMGWGVIDSQRGAQKLIEAGAIITTPKQTFPDRLKQIKADMETLLLRFRPDEIAFEELFFAKNVTTALTVGAARGVAVAACADYTEQLYEYTPMQIKQAIVGYGGAEKRQIQLMVKLMLRLPDIIRPDDAADAVAIAMTHANTGMAKTEFKMK